MSAFSDSATNQLHITPRTGVTAEGKPSTVISTAYYRIPFQRLLKGSTPAYLPRCIAVLTWFCTLASSIIQYCDSTYCKISLRHLKNRQMTILALFLYFIIL